MTPQEKEDAIFEYHSKKGSEMVSHLWDKVKTKKERREHMAIPIYARKVKNYGKTEADAWLIKFFGPERGEALLQLPSFKRQWIKYL